MYQKMMTTALTIFEEIQEYDSKLGTTVRKAKDKIYEYEALDAKQSLFEAYFALKESSGVIDKILTCMQNFNSAVALLPEGSLTTWFRVHESVFGMTERHLVMKSTISDVEEKLLQLNEIVNKPHRRLMPYQMQNLHTKRSKMRGIRCRVRRSLQK